MGDGCANLATTSLNYHASLGGGVLTYKDLVLLYNSTLHLNYPWAYFEGEMEVRIQFIFFLCQYRHFNQISPNAYKLLSYNTFARISVDPQR